MSEIDVSKLKNEIACKENIINHLADSNVSLQKQLQQLKQENEALKQSEQEGLEIIAELEKENEELKKQIAKQANAKIQLENLDSRFAQDYCIVKHKLEKIKEVITQRNTDCWVCGDYKEGYCKGVGECEGRDYKSILKLIEEQE